jgi:hypothetical protein
MRNFLIQTPSFAAFETAMYSAFVVESATISYLELFQLTTPPFNVNTNPDCDFESSLLVLEASISVTRYSEFLITSID